ncbi:unnamed protein product [Allacma fusca]|uniref:Uncharacterized protein n=1 Tax=Allacma fusca TaxID=39272 RepID=A0A8J2NXX9_9HEXA|nr:unnamed protein product [Allacma fusca]
MTKPISKTSQGSEDNNNNIDKDSESAGIGMGDEVINISFDDKTDSKLKILKEMSEKEGSEDEQVSLTKVSITKKRVAKHDVSSPRGQTLEMDVITSGLSDLRRNLTNRKFTFCKLVAEGKLVDDISILSSFIHLRSLHLRNNRISDLTPLGQLEFLEILDASNNCIESPKSIPMLKHLKILNLSKNQLRTIAGFLPNFITHLNLRGNLLSSLEGMSSYIFPNVTHLEVRGNYLTSLKPMQLPRLEELYAAQNQLVSVGGLHKSSMLKVLHLRGNKIASLRELPSLVNLQYVNLRNNRICRFTETVYLTHSPSIHTLILKGNPIAESLRYRAETIASVNQLRRLDKYMISAVETGKGRDIFLGRMRGHIAPLMDDPAVATPPTTAGRIEVENLPTSRACPPNSAVNRRLVEIKDLDSSPT